MNAPTPLFSATQYPQSPSVQHGAHGMNCLSSRGVELGGLEARVASRLASGLSINAAALPHDICERLRVAREQAVAQARTARLARTSRVAAASSQAATATSSVSAGIAAGAAVLLGRGVPMWQRFASALPLVALVAGLVMIDRQGQHEQVQAAASIDAQLLSDDLPPAAYSDPGFAEFLRSTAYSPVSSVNAQVGEGD